MGVVNIGIAEMQEPSALRLPEGGRTHAAVIPGLRRRQQPRQRIPNLAERPELIRHGPTSNCGMLHPSGLPRQRIYRSLLCIISHTFRQIAEECSARFGYLRLSALTRRSYTQR